MKFYSLIILALAVSIAYGAESYEQLARQALADQLAVPIEQIQVISAQSRQWPNSALGCPQPGRLYAQVITPGYRVVLKANGIQYAVHTSDKRAVVCNKISAD